MLNTNILIRLLILFICLLSPRNTMANSIQNKYKLKFDNYLDTLETNFQLDEQDSICNNSKGTLKLLEKRSNELKKVEPNYDWKSISILLKKINKDYCL